MINLREWQQKAYNNIKKDSGIIIAATGAGKTVVALQLIFDNPQDKTLIVVPTIMLMNQWYDEIIRLGLLSEKEISRIGGGYKEYPTPLGVTIAVINSLQNINLESEIAKFDHAVFDECHRYATENSLQVINSLQCNHMIGLTATLERPDDSETYLKQLIGPVAYKMDLGSEEAKEYVSDFEIENIPLSLDPSDYEQYKIENTEFLKALQAQGYDLTKLFKNARRNRKGLDAMKNRKDIVQKNYKKIEETIKICEKYKEQKILIFDESKENAEKIYKQLKNKGYKTGIYHSGITKKENAQTMEDYKNNNTNILVTVRALDEGMNVPNINIAIIVNGNSQKRQFFQRLGRAIRKEKGKMARIIMLYFKNTHETKIIEKRMGYL